MKTEHKVLLLSVLAGLAVWLADAIVDYLVFYEGTFWGLLVLEVPLHELYFRSLVLLAFLVWGLVAAGYARRRNQAERNLREGQEADRKFHERLKALHEVTTELSAAQSFDDLCRQAVELGRGRLGFDRLSMWFTTDEPHVMNGSYGVDEKGYLRDERAMRIKIAPGNLVRRILTRKIPMAVNTNAPLRDATGKVVGVGTHMVAALWNGHEVIGYFSNDNLLRGEELTAEGTETLRLYASALGHLCSQKRAEDALRASEAKYRRILETAEEGVWIIDADNKIGFVNAKMAEMLGYGVEEMLGRPIFDFLDPDDRPIAEQRLARRRQGIAEQLEYKFVRKDGSHLWALVSAAPTWDDDGNYAGALGMVTDITARRQAFRALHESREQLRYLSGAASEGIVIHENGVLLEANDQFYELFGYQPSELEGKSVIPIVVAPESVPDMQERIKSGATLPYEAIGLRKDGTRFPMEIRAKPMEYQGRAVRVGTIRDISERRAYEQALRQERDFANSLVDTAQTIVLVLDKKGRIRRFNKFAQDLTGYTLDEVRDKDWLELFLQDKERPRIEDVFAALMSGQERTGIANPIVTKDGRTILIRWYNSVLTDSKGDPVGVLAIGHDITEIRQKESQLRQAAKMEAIGRLAGGIAHDFNNMMAIIQGYADLLIQSMSPDDEYQDDIKRIRTAASRAASLTKQLLAFGRKQISQPKVMQLNETITAMESMLQRVIGEDVELVVDLADRPWQIKADPSQVEQVILNLVVNAREAMPKGGTLTIHTANSSLRMDQLRDDPDVVPGDYFMLAVSDTGVGMSPEVSAHIFEPFFTTKADGKGTGLGLATCHGIVKQHGGHIEVDTGRAKGTTFRLYLPRAKEKAEWAAEDAEGAAGQLIRGTETIIIAEDEESVRQLLVRVLRDAGYTVLETGNASEALPLGSHYEGQIDLLVTDVVMPGLSGDELAKRLGKKRPKMRVLYISGYAGEGAFRPGSDTADTGFLAKPFSPSALTVAVREILDAGKPKQTPRKSAPRGKRTTKKRPKA